MATTVLMESAPKPKSNLSPIPLMLHIKFYQDWPINDLRDLLSIENLICPQGTKLNSYVTDLIQPEFELVRDFIPVLVTSKFGEDPIKNEHAGLETPFPHCKSMGIFLNTQGPQLRREWSHLAETTRFYACPRYVQVWRRSNQNWRR